MSPTPQREGAKPACAGLSFPLSCGRGFYINIGSCLGVGLLLLFLGLLRNMAQTNWKANHHCPETKPEPPRVSNKLSQMSLWPLPGPGDLPLAGSVDRVAAGALCRGQEPRVGFVSSPGCSHACGTLPLSSWHSLLPIVTQAAPQGCKPTSLAWEKRYPSNFANLLP